MTAPRRPFVVRPLRRGDETACERILRGLPGWFGIEDAVRAYVGALSPEATTVAERDGAVAGFLSLLRHTPFAAEIRVMAVDASLHGRGAGRALLEDAERRLVAEGVEYLQVKTLGPSRLCEEYERTRGFYAHAGFRALEELELWGPENPCLILVRRLG